MNRIKSRSMIILIAALVLVISLLNYSTDLGLHHYFVIFRELYFLPIVLAGFWFGLRGGLITSLSVTALYLPLVLLSWQNFSPDDLDKLIEVLFFIIVAMMLGMLRDREWLQQKRLREAESFAAMGKAMAGIAHDMKTPLIAIGGFSRLAQKEFEEDHPGYQKLEIVIRETRRLENMMKDMLDFARPLALQWEQGDLNKLVTESLTVVEDEAQKRKVDIRHTLSEDLPPVAMDTMRMERVLINLIMNAIQASPEGETVTVQTYQDRHNVVVDIADRGCGIPIDQKEKIFNPFFTTKKDGTGLGLPIVKKIVEAHEGYLTIVNNPEKGITFRLMIPIARSRSKALSCLKSVS